MLKGNEFVHITPIHGVNPKYLQKVEFVDSIDTGETKKFITDSFEKSTPVFDRISEIIPLSDKSCMFLGQTMGYTKLYVVKGSHEKQDRIFMTVDLEGSPRDLKNINQKYILINSYNGMYFFDKETLKRSSEIFDNIMERKIDGENIYFFEKRVGDDETSKTIMGYVTLDGEISDFVFDDSIKCLKSTPKKEKQKKYEELDYAVLYKELDQLTEKNKSDKEEYIKKLSRIHKAKDYIPVVRKK